MVKRFLLVLTTLVVVVSTQAQKKILFDNTKSETASNADWIIDDDEPIPSPAQSGITQSTTETYWQGALSSWGVEMVKRGFYVETLPASGSITYGNSSNSQDLSKYDVFVVCEPNNQFSAAEKQAIIDFVQNGGGLFIVADHAVADRDGDGWDALEVWNDFFSTYNNPFGFTLDPGSNISIDPAKNVANLPDNPILHGPAGDVDGLAFYNGGTFTIDKSANSTAIGLVYNDGYSNSGTTGVMAVCATYGSGRVVAVGDSSVPEDETAHDNSHTYPGWSQPLNAGNATGDNGVFVTNATIWLTESTSSPMLSSSESALSGFSYTPGNGPSAQQSFSISGENLDGSKVTITAPASYEVSADNINYAASIEVSYTAPTLPSKNIFVRLKTGLAEGVYNETLAITDNGSASDLSISLNGEVSSTVTILTEDFASCLPASWQVFSVTSNKDWTCNSQGYIEINGYNGDVASDDWLISPALDLGGYSNITLTFDSWTKYSDTNIPNPEVKVFYSTDYPGSGNPENYTWTELSYNYPAENSQVWTSSGGIDLSDASAQNAYIAFQYLSSGTTSGSAAYWSVDNVVITAKVQSTSYTISATVTPSGSGSVSGTGAYNYGSTCTLTASSNTGYDFNGWYEGENLVSTNPTLSFTVTGKRSLEARFSLKSFEILATVNPTNGGTVSGTGTYTFNSTCTLTAVPESGFEFTAWLENGNQVSTNSTLTFTVTESRSFEAQFSTINSDSFDELNSVRVYPNPFRDMLMVDFAGNDFSSVEVIDVIGNVVYSKTNLSQTVAIDLSNYTKGVYFVRITMVRHSKIVKLIKQ
jgi:uncharacterized repeat protein (TIGR02543 family)